MKLTVWTYEGPPHVGAMRVATGMKGVHYVLHAPQGDTYADLLFTMIERRDARPPVTYTTFQARDLGGDTAELFKRSCRDAVERFQPEALLVGASCTAELIQDDPGGLAARSDLGLPVVPLELPSYSKKENWGAAETFYQIVRRLADADLEPAPREGRRPRANILGPTALGFRHRDDLAEIARLLDAIGIDLNLAAPMSLSGGARPSDIARIRDADVNIVLYPEIAGTAADWLKRKFGQPRTSIVPIGVGATRDFVRELAGLVGLDPEQALRDAERADPPRLPWWSRSVDSTYLTGKRVFIFGDATHAIAAARVAAEEIGFEVVGLGAYNREFARDLRAAAERHGVEALVTDDYLEVEAAIAAAQPELVLGTQMERHVAKRLGIPCAVISAPVHVQDFPAHAAPQMGFAGAGVLFDAWVHPLVMGLEEHLLGMFREDFEFHDAAGPSHLGGRAAPRETADPEPAPDAAPKAEAGAAAALDAPDAIRWTDDAQRELKKVPFFVRGKARRNTERFAEAQGLATITLETLYDAKAHFGR
ncbi:MAG: ferredoxin:protochlorophyllide reductase (ATP-dependent) subunit B [Pseudomonadota bacterium]